MFSNKPDPDAVQLERATKMALVMAEAALPVFGEDYVREIRIEAEEAGEPELSILGMMELFMERGLPIPAEAPQLVRNEFDDCEEELIAAEAYIQSQANQAA